MHRFLIFLNIITWSLFLNGCDNNNNNNTISKKTWLTCVECEKQMQLYKLSNHDKIIGLFGDYNSYVPHFDRYHRCDYQEEIKARKNKNSKEKVKEYIKKKFTKEITTVELKEELAKEYKNKKDLKKIGKKLDIDFGSDDDSAVPTPIGSPVNEHSKQPVVFASESESDTAHLTVHNPLVRAISQRSKRRIVSIAPSNRKPKLSIQQFFPEDDVKEETKKRLKIKEQDQEAAAILVSMDEICAVKILTKKQQ